MDWGITDDGKYKIESLSAATFHGALKIIKESFCQDEIVCICTEINKNEVAVEELMELCAVVALDGVSLVALHIETGEVAAVAFNKIQVATKDESEKQFFETFAAERCTHPSSRALVELMAELDGQCNFFDKFGLKCSFETMFLATLRHHRNLKLGKILGKTSVKLAKKLKDGPVSTISVKDLGPKYSFIQERKPMCEIPKFCHALCSAKASLMIAKSLGFSVYLRIPFTELSHNGKSYAQRFGADGWVEAVALIL